jgi:crotonobetainyl-CoA:carnitine CoA-transferase CaiB-like acyl-CoA transferase
MAVPNSFHWTGQVFDPADTFRGPGALRGVRVCDPGTIALTPSTASYLGGFGAEVTKADLPGAAQLPAHHRARGPR